MSTTATPPPTAPNMRQFSLNSAEAHQLLRADAPSMLPRLPAQWRNRPIPGGTLWMEENL